MHGYTAEATGAVATHRALNAGGGSGGVLAATKILTDSQIQGLNATRVEVIAAPGAAKMIVPLSAVFIPSVGGGAYGSFTGANLFLGTQTDEAALLDIIDEAGLGLLLVAGYLFQVSTNQGAAASTTLGFTQQYEPYGFENEPLVVGVYGGGPFSGGDAANTLTIIVHYAVADL
jgi:hypothetical protein